MVLCYCSCLDLLCQYTDCARIQTNLFSSCLLINMSLCWECTIGLLWSGRQKAATNCKRGPLLLGFLINHQWCSSYLGTLSASLMARWSEEWNLHPARGHHTCNQSALCKVSARTKLFCFVLLIHLEVRCGLAWSPQVVLKYLIFDSTANTALGFLRSEQKSCKDIITLFKTTGTTVKFVQEYHYLNSRNKCNFKAGPCCSDFTSEILSELPHLISSQQKLYLTCSG